MARRVDFMNCFGPAVKRIHFYLREMDFDLVCDALQFCKDLKYLVFDEVDGECPKVSISIRQLVGCFAQSL